MRMKKRVTDHLSFAVQTLYSLEEPQSIRTKGNFSLKIIMPSITRVFRSLTGFHLLTRITFESLQLPNPNLAFHNECCKMFLVYFVIQNYTIFLMVTFTLCKLHKFQMQKNCKYQTDCHFSLLIEQSLLGFGGQVVFS